MVVMIIIDVLMGMGGAERNLYILSRGLRDRGHTVIVCCLKGGKVSESMVKEGFIVEELSVQRLYAPHGIKAFLKLIKIVMRQKVSVIISYHKDSDYMGLLLSILTRTPIISSRRDMGFDLKHRHKWIYRKINRFYDRITAVSEAVKSAILTTQGAGPVRVTVIHNGVNLNADAKENSSSWREDILESDSTYVKIGCIANIRPIKGQVHLVDAARLVFDQFPNVRFVLIGIVVERTYGKEVLDRIREHGLEDVVKLIGPVEKSRVPDVWKTVDICVVPSLSEGMSNALLEAMAAGKPVIATAVGGNVEVLKNGETGYLVPPEDPEAMAEGINKLLLDPFLRREMGLRARYWAKTNFSDEMMIENYEDLLISICLRRTGRMGALR
jgi:L-malate glycosyltransferase